MKEKVSEVMGAIRPDGISWIGAAVGAVIAWFTGLPALAQALLIVQGADVLTGLLCALTGKSDKSASGKISSSALVMGLVKKGLEWLVVLICVYAVSYTHLDVYKRQREETPDAPPAGAAFVTPGTLVLDGQSIQILSTDEGDITITSAAGMTFTFQGVNKAGQQMTLSFTAQDIWNAVITD